MESRKITRQSVYLILALLLVAVWIGLRWADAARDIHPLSGAQLVRAGFEACIDGDTARLRVNGQSEKVRFLAIDTPETDPATRDGIETFGQEASQMTCDALKTATRIELEADPQTAERDDYGRLLVWVFTDGHLLQAELVKQGLAQVAYLYGDYAYTDELMALQTKAEASHIGIWSR